MFCAKKWQGTLLFVSLLAMAFAMPQKAQADSPQEEMVTRLIIKPRQQRGMGLMHSLQIQDATSLSKVAIMPLTVVRPMSGGAHVVKLDKAVSLSAARVIAARLMRDPSVELAEPDRVMHALTTTPTDPSYATLQWHYFTPSGANKGGANLPPAWNLTTGDAAITVAVLDTGYRPHEDLGLMLGPTQHGYDFISDSFQANDGDGRDDDARDPGDWVTLADIAAQPDRCAGQQRKDSSWHGTHVIGTIAALMSTDIPTTGKGGTGVAPGVKILPLRVLGKCGGSMFDIIDAMRWAAGLPVPGAPHNNNPAKLLNLSLGGTGACSQSMQDAVNEIVAAGAVIVAASGNSGENKSASLVGTPANCRGVIAVTSHAIDGDNAFYSDIGPEVTLSAPGGGCGTITRRQFTCNTLVSSNGLGVFSTLNNGTTSPNVDSYAAYQGTSMAAPHVSGVVALMLSINNSLTPAQVKSYLQSSARPHPAGTTCTLATYTGKCGAGLLDAQLALSAVTAAAPTASVTSPAVVAPGSTVTLDGSGMAGSGWSISAYAWTQVFGAPVSLSGSNTVSAKFTAPDSGIYTFRLTVTDNGGQTGFVYSSPVRVNSPPVLGAVADQSGLVGSTISFNVTATDADGDTPVFQPVSLPSGASLSPSGAFTWPNAGPAGTYELTYYARDNDANSAQGSVKITINAPQQNLVSPISSSSSGGGGGGSFDESALLGLALLAAGLRIRRVMKKANIH